MSVETLKSAVSRMKSLLVNKNFDYCRKANTIWCEEHFSEDYICENCITEAFQCVLDAFDRERELISERGYDRGYRDGRQARSVTDFQLDQDRIEFSERLNALGLNGGGSHAMLNAIASAIYEPSAGWTKGACETLRKRLVWLLVGGDTKVSDGHERRGDNGGTGDCDNCGCCVDSSSCGCGGCDLRQKEPQEMSFEELADALRIAVNHEAYCEFSNEWCVGFETCNECRKALVDLLAKAHERETNGFKVTYRCDSDVADALGAKITKLEKERDELRSQLDELDMSGATHTYKMLKKMLGEAKNAADNVRAHAGRMVETGKELNRLKSENAMYRRMLNDAAQEYKTVIEENRNMEKGISMLVDGLRHAEDTVGE